MSAQASISVIIPTHNRAELVRRAVLSVLAQRDAPPIEVVVVDDASEDHTARVLAEFGSSIRVVRTPEPIERARSRNLGVEHSRAEVVAFLDSDDEWLPEKAASQYPVAVAGHACVTAIEIIDGDGRTLKIHTPPASAARTIHFENLYLAAPSTLMLPRSFFETIGGFPTDPAVQGSEDWLLLSRLVGSGKEIVVVPEPLVRYRVHGQNSTADPTSVARSMWAAVDRMESEGLVQAAATAAVRAHVAGVIGRQFASRRRWREAAAWGRTAFSSKPWPFGLKSCSLIAASALRGSFRRA